MITLARGIPEGFLRGLWNGETSSWVTLGILLAIIVAMHVAHKCFGWKPLSRRERRAARERRKIVLWKYERDQSP